MNNQRNSIDVSDLNRGIYCGQIYSEIISPLKVYKK